ncbi:aldehyde dehydrogenase family protein [Amycolatopsis thermoflava]|uniref:aldehyde dehydrogenase family protein n=1 Tax=Amycolatopsis thermoflava TaxID=84480 RepID=UPI000480DCC6|nr:aldehyde dehydrogenase family protein [Amycolatopsis thermoflava]
MRDVLRHYIDGAWTEPLGDGTAPITNPATGETSGVLALGTSADVDRAAAAARRAFATYSQTSVTERADLLAAIAAEYERRAEDMALAVTADIGTPLAIARITAQAGVGQFRELAEALPAYPFEEHRGRSTVRKEPIGVCALIPPWNYPALQMTEKVAPALAAGCTMILKPAEIAPYSAQVFAEIIEAAGVPQGVFNMVLGKGSVIGAALSKHPEVDLVSFTGSTSVGVQVQKDAADTVKRVTQELGGKSAHIILPDADLTSAVATAVTGVMTNSGQTCAAPTRTLIPRARRDEIVSMIRTAVDAVTVGDPLTPVAMGPVASEQQWHTVQRYIQAGLDEGATLVTGGLGQPEGAKGGWFARPTVFADVTNDMTIAREEIFGPVMTLISYDTVEEAVAIANDSPYGLAAYVDGGDPAQVRDVAARLRAGQVALNGAPLDQSAPFGGYKQSGNGRVWGIAGLDECLEIKAVVGSAS